MVGDRCTAEDLLQETVLRVFRRIDRYRERGAFRAWVYRIATNLAITELRRKRFCAGTLDEQAGRMEDRSVRNAQEMMEAREREEILREGIAALPEEQKAVLLLRVRRGFGIREIAETLGIPEGTVKSRIHHGVKKLRVHFSRREGTGGEQGIS